MTKRYLDASGLNQYNTSMRSLIDGNTNTAQKIIKLMTLMSYYGTDSSTLNNPEFQTVIIDSSDHVLAGWRVDGSAYIADL
jgi:hypothetical protein